MEPQGPREQPWFKAEGWNPGFNWVAVKELKLSYYIIHHNGESNGKENGK